MRKRKTTSELPNFSLDMVSSKKRRGRPFTISPVQVRTTADNDRRWLVENWGKLHGPLLAARTEQEVKQAFLSVGFGFDDFLGRARVILNVLRDPKLPKRDEARINFVADSIAGGEVVTPRTSRDICAKERKGDKKRSSPPTCEFMIRCSCGYEGFSLIHRCKGCGTDLSLFGSNVATM